MIDVTKKFLLNVKEDGRYDDCFETIYMFYTDKILSGYKILQFYGRNNDTFTYLGAGDVLSFNEKFGYLRMDCNIHGVFKFWHRDNKIKLDGYLDKNIVVTDIKRT